MERDLAPIRMREYPTLAWRISSVVLIGSLVVAVVMYAATVLAHAQSGVCTLWPAMKESFAKSYDELPIGGGVINQQQIVTVMASPDGSTFTIVIVNSNGLACAVIAGTGWNPGVLPTKGM